jgi:hypothetical protein
MSVKSFLAKYFAAYEVHQFNKTISQPILAQNKVFANLIHVGKKTTFGKDHHFDKIDTYEDFKKYIPLRDYEDLAPYITLIKEGHRDVLWKGLPKYFAKTSGTTSGVKYIPISDTSIRYQVRAARMSLQYFIHEQKQTSWVDGKMIFLQGSPELETIAGIPTGRLSGITYHEVPSYLLKNRKPSFLTNCIEDWEAKVAKIVEETMHEDMTLISGIPPWVIMYFEQLLKRTGKNTVAEVFPNLALYVHGGVNFQPYRDTFRKMIGKDIGYIETFPASEGFIGFQNTQKDDDHILVVDGGIFYEFVKVNDIFNADATRLSLADVQLDTNYAIILNTDAGLWGYIIGDTVRFSSLSPYRIRVTGRIKHYISAFGEHVIGEEVEKAMVEACTQLNISVKEFTVAPQIQVNAGTLPYHEWIIEFDEKPQDLELFTKILDNKMCEKNIYYKDLISGGILQSLVISSVSKNAFRHYMESIGKLGGQNKIPRLSNDRKIADAMQRYKD